MYCLHLKGMKPGDLVLGNSVFSMGFIGGLAAAGRGFLGGEVTQITNVIHEGRLEAVQANGRGSQGARRRSGSPASPMSCARSTATSSFFRWLPASTRRMASLKQLRFSTSADGQELYCQLDAGFTPCSSCSATWPTPSALAAGSWRLKSHGARRDQGIQRRL